MNVSSATGVTQFAGHLFADPTVQVGPPPPSQDRLVAKQADSQDDITRKFQQDGRAEFERRRTGFLRVDGLQTGTNGKTEPAGVPGSGTDEAKVFPQGANSTGQAETQGKPVPTIPIPGAAAEQVPEVRVPSPPANREGAAAALKLFQQQSAEKQIVKEEVVKAETQKTEEKKRVSGEETKKQEVVQRTTKEQQAAQAQALDRRAVELKAEGEKNQAQNSVRKTASEHDEKELQQHEEARSKVFLDVQRRLAEVFQAQSRLPFVGKHANVSA